MKKIGKLILIILEIILIVFIFIGGIILVDAYTHEDKVPSFFGWKPFIVLSGSMETNIMAGDIVIIKEVDTSTLKVNDIIAFKTSDETVITHRIIEIIVDEDGEVKYKTKGDNNNVEDEGYVYPMQVEGIYKFRIAKMGNFAMEIQKPKGMIIAISIPIIFLFVVQSIDFKQEKKLAKQKEDMAKQIEEELAKFRKQDEKNK